MTSVLQTTTPAIINNGVKMKYHNRMRSWHAEILGGHLTTNKSGIRIEQQVDLKQRELAQTNHVNTNEIRGSWHEYLHES
jgi:hypothetical protein